MHRMTRRVEFSSGHRYWNPAFDLHQNQALYGKWASPYNHGHNYALEACVEGPVQLETGMIMNIKRIDALLRDRIVSKFDQKSINDEIAEFMNVSPSLENLLLHFWRSIPAELEGVRMKSLRLIEKPTLYGEIEIEGETTTMTLTRIYEFAASQRLHAPSLSAEENQRLYGVCNNPEGYGHNYVLEVTVEGEPDVRTGFICDLGAFDDTVKSLVIDRYDHKCLFRDLPEFEGKITTCENILQAIHESLKNAMPAQLVRLRLWETPRNMFELCVR